MRILSRIALRRVVAASIVLVAQACASTDPGDPARASRNEAGQAALEGMENAVLKDNDPNSPVVRSKPAK